MRSKPRAAPTPCPAWLLWSGKTGLFALPGGINSQSNSVDATGFNVIKMSSERNTPTRREEPFMVVSVPSQPPQGNPKSLNDKNREKLVDFAGKSITGEA